MNLRRIRNAVAALLISVVAVGFSTAPDDAAAPSAHTYSAMDTGWGFK